jgi:putative chitinase
MAINQKFFFDTVRARLFNGKITAQQMQGLSAILDEWETNHWEKDDRYLAYILATVYHETDRKFQGIREYGRGAGRKYGRPHPVTRQVYYGRGFVQLTWDYNYSRMSSVVGVDLMNNPDAALDLRNCVKITFFGMLNGSFTTKKLSDYFTNTREDWVGARRIINGKDKANLIADYAKKFYGAISYTTN